MRQVDGAVARPGLGQLRQADEQEQDERDGGEERVKGERARQEGDVVFVGRLQGAAEETAEGTMPAAESCPVQMTGSSSSATAAARRRTRASASRRSSSSRAE